MSTENELLQAGGGQELRRGASDAPALCCGLLYRMRPCQEHEDERVTDEEEDDVGTAEAYRHVYRGAMNSRRKEARIGHLRYAYIVGIQEVQRAPHIEYPGDRNCDRPSPGEGCHGQEREDGSNEVSPSDLACETGAQRRGHEPRDHEIHSEEPERIEGGEEP